MSCSDGGDLGREVLEYGEGNREKYIIMKRMAFSQVGSLLLFLVYK